MRSPLAAELKSTINATPTTVVVEAASQAQVVLEALADERQRSVVATTSAAQVREFQLRARLRFRLRTPAGKELIPDSEILLRRELSYTETAALAKEREEGLLYRAMQTDIVTQVLRGWRRCGRSDAGSARSSSPATCRKACGRSTPCGATRPCSRKRPAT